jgi:signal transduction histidine kinase
MALDSANRMLNLVESLLTIHKGNAMALDRVPVKLSEMVQAVAWTLNASLEKARINLNVSIPDSLPQAVVDHDKMMRVVQNLLDNAIRYSPAGGEIRIWATYDHNLDKIVLRINDSGPGIPDKDREKVFEQFWQVKENRPQRGSKGSGIGLAFCLRVVQAHGEKIWVEEKSKSPLSGACFAFTLPASRE